MIIDPQYIDEILQEDIIDNTNSEHESFDIDKYISQIRNVGTNYKSENRTNNNVGSTSEDELRQRYEAELLKEKYGSDYEKMINTTYENYLSEDYYRLNNENNQKNNINSTPAVTYNGIALVYVELENTNRENSYIHVPVFTCENGGTVTVSISISSDGRVRSANILSTEANGDPTCISNAAKDAALKSRFTTVSGTGNEKGKIIYNFIEQ